MIRTIHSSSVPAAKRVSRRDPRPSDVGIALIDKRIQAFTRLKAVVVTDEYNKIANLVYSLDPYQAQNPTMDADSARVEFYCSHSGLNRWEDPRLVDFLVAVTKLDPDTQEMKEFKDYYNRDYKWSWKFQDGLEIRLNFGAYEKKETSECQRIQVGTKTVEQPIYRYDCVVPEGTKDLDALPAPVLAIDL